MVGAVTAPGRLNAAIQYAVERASAQPGVSATLLNLADYRVSFADGRPPDRFTDDTARVVATLAGSDAALIASPVYRGSFTGALKNLLDLTPVDALRSKRALVTPTSVYLESAHFQDGKLADAGARAALDDLVTALLAMAACPRDRLGPPPLASAGR